MSDPSLGGAGDDEFLTVRVGGEGHERVLLISRPQAGRVNVREWTTQTWSQEGARYEIDPTTLLEQLETAYARRQPVSEEMYALRIWLTGKSS